MALCYNFIFLYRTCTSNIPAARISSLDLLLRDKWALVYMSELWYTFQFFQEKKIVSVQFWLWIRRVWSFLTTIFAIIVIILNIIILFYLDKHNQISIYFGNSDTKCVNYHSFYFYLFQISLQHHDILIEY